MQNQWLTSPLSLNILSFVTFPIWAVVFFWSMRPKQFAPHVVAIKATSRNVRTSFVFKGNRPAIRIEGQFTPAGRLWFLLYPFAFISVVCWTVSTLSPAFSFTCLCIAATNASGSISDFVRGGVAIKGWLRGAS